MSHFQLGRPFLQLNVSSEAETLLEIEHGTFDDYDEVVLTIRPTYLPTQGDKVVLVIEKRRLKGKTENVKTDVPEQGWRGGLSSCVALSTM